MTTIVFAHPWHGSFNKGILDTVVKQLEADNKEYTIIDLNKDNFNPVFTEQELALFAKGQYLDPLVGKYREILSKTTNIIFIFPIWWFSAPAILKGFCDKLFLKDYAYVQNKYDIMFGLLKNIRTTTMITTSNSPKLFIRFCVGNPIGGTLSRMFMFVGMKGRRWLHCSAVKKHKLPQREKFLAKVANFVSRLK